MRRLAAGALVGIATLPGCGTGAQATFTSASFVAAANHQGARIELGEPLGFGREGVDEHSLRFLGTGHGQAVGGQAATDVHGAGTLAVFGSDDEALAEYVRCEGADLVCYRADNVTLTFSGSVNPADLARLATALQRLADG